MARTSSSEFLPDIRPNPLLLKTAARSAASNGHRPVENDELLQSHGLERSPRSDPDEDRLRVLRAM